MIGKAWPPPHTPDTPNSALPGAPSKREPLLPPDSGPRVPHTTGIRSPEFVDTVRDLACRELSHGSTKAASIKKGSDSASALRGEWCNSIHHETCSVSGSLA